MTFIKIAGIAILGTVAVLMTKQHRADIGAVLGVTCAASLLLYAVAELYPAVSFIKDLAEETYFSQYIKILLKALGIAVISQLAGDFCRDSGENAIASKVELTARIAILLLGLPVIRDLLAISADILG